MKQSTTNYICTTHNWHFNCCLGLMLINATIHTALFFYRIALLGTSVHPKLSFAIIVLQTTRFRDIWPVSTYIHTEGTHDCHASSINRIEDGWKLFWKYHLIRRNVLGVLLGHYSSRRLSAGPHPCLVPVLCIFANAHMLLNNLFLWLFYRTSCQLQQACIFSKYGTGKRHLRIIDKVMYSIVTE